MKAQPKDYKHIDAWGRMLGSYSYYIVGEQTKAAEDNAPLDAIFYDDREKRWHTYEEINSPSTKEDMRRRLEKMEQP
jgi:hypothetical protein